MRGKIKTANLTAPLNDLISFEGLLSLYVLSGLFKSIMDYYQVDPGVDLTFLVFILICLRLFAGALSKRKIQLPSRNAMVLIAVWAVFYLWILVTLFFTPSPSYGYTKSLKIFTNVIFIIILFRGSLDFEKFVRLSLIYSLIVLAWYLPLRFLYYSGSSPRGYEYTRPFMGMYLSLSIPLGLFLTTIITTQIRAASSHLVHNAVLMIGLLGMLMMGARGPILFLLLAVVLWHLTHHKIKGRIGLKSALAMLLLLAGTILVLYFMGDKIFALIRVTIMRLSLLLEGFFTGRTDFGTSVNERLVMIREAVDLIFASPATIIFGNGIGSFGLLTIGEDIRHYPHNFILEIWCELGLTGLILFTGLLVMVFRRIRVKGGVINIFPMFYILLNFLKSGNLEDMRLMFVFMAIYFIKTERVVTEKL